MAETPVIVKQSPDWVMPVVLVGGLGILGYAAYLAFFRKGPKSLVIDSITNLATGKTAKKGEKLYAVAGNTIRADFHFSYEGPEAAVTYDSRFFFGTLTYPGSKTITDTLAASLIPHDVKGQIDIPLDTPVIFAGDYSLYVKVETEEGKAETNWLTCIQIGGGGPAAAEITIVSFDTSVANGGTFHVNCDVKHTGAMNISLYGALGNHSTVPLDVFIVAHDGNIKSEGRKSFSLPDGGVDAVDHCAFTFPVHADPASSPWDLEVAIEGTSAKAYKDNQVTVTGPPLQGEIGSVEIVQFSPNPAKTGDTLHMGIYFTYRGPAKSVHLVGQIGSWTLGVFHQLSYGEANQPMAASQDWEAALIDVGVPVSEAAGTYSLDAIADEFKSEVMANALVVSPAPPATGTFRVEPLPATLLYGTTTYFFWETETMNYLSRGYLMEQLPGAVGEFIDDTAHPGVPLGPYPVPLRGRLTVFIFQADGSYVAYGPSAVYDVLNGGTYDFNVNTLEMWRV